MLVVGWAAITTLRQGLTFGATFKVTKIDHFFGLGLIERYKEHWHY